MAIVGRNKEINGWKITLRTTEGVQYNEYSGFFQKVVTLDNLFQKIL